MSDETVDLFDLDTDLDDVADLVQFVNPHNGTHVFGIAFAGMDKIGSDRMGVKIIYQMVETLEAESPDDAAAPVGSVWQESFMGGDMGKKLLKMRIKQFFGDDIKGAMRPYIDTMMEKGRSEFMVKMTTKLVKTKSKNKETGEINEYENVRVLDASAVAPPTLPEKWEWLDYTPRTLDD